MKRTPVYLISALSSDYRSYLLKDDAHALLFTERRWGEPVSRDWITPELIPSELSRHRPDADFASVYSPSLVIATGAAATTVEFPELELIPIRVGSEARCLLNPRIILRRFRAEGADVAQVPSGAVLLMRKADFYADDVPAHPCCFWFHDGNSPRFLLCNESFQARIRSARLSGLSFRLLGHAF